MCLFTVALAAALRVLGMPQDSVVLDILRDLTPFNSNATGAAVPGAVIWARLSGPATAGHRQSSLTCGHSTHSGAADFYILTSPPSIPFCAARLTAAVLVLLVYCPS